MTTNPFEQHTDGESAYARFVAGATAEDTKPEPKAQEKKPEPLNPAQVQAKLLLYTLQFDTSAAVVGYVKDQKETEINKLVERASDEFGTNQFTVNATLVDGTKEELSKISVNRTKPETRVDSPTKLLDWAIVHRPDVTESTRRISPHIDPKIMEEVFAFLEEHHPGNVEDVTELKPNAKDLILADAEIQGTEIHAPAHEIIDPETGEMKEVPAGPVPGMSYDKGGKYKSFTLTHGGKGQPNQIKALTLLGEKKIAGTDFREVMANPLAALEQKK